MLDALQTRTKSLSKMRLLLVQISCCSKSLTIKGPEIFSLQIINIYNAPPGATNPGAGVSFLLSLTSISLNPKLILTGDFNIHHPNWNLSYNGSPSTQSSDLICWLEDNDLSLLSEVNVPTHNLGNVLDLCFASSSLLIGGAHATVQQDLDVSSDHSPLLINVPCQVRSNPSSPRLRFATIQLDTSLSLLRSHLDSFILLSEKSSDCLDKRAEDIIQILYNCFSGSANQSLPHNRGQPWWNQSCKEARKTYREKLRNGNATGEDRQAFRKAVRQARSLFLQKVIEMQRVT